jgi:hypothetical protein
LERLERACWKSGTGSVGPSLGWGWFRCDLLDNLHISESRTDALHSKGATSGWCAGPHRSSAGTRAGCLMRFRSLSTRTLLRSSVRYYHLSSALYAEQAFLGPALLDLTVGYAVDEDPRPSNRVIGKVNTCSPALGSNASLPAGYYFVSLDYLVLNRRCRPRGKPRGMR